MNTFHTAVWRLSYFHGLYFQAGAYNPPAANANPPNGSANVLQVGGGQAQLQACIQSMYQIQAPGAAAGPQWQQPPARWFPYGGSFSRAVQAQDPTAWAITANPSLYHASTLHISPEYVELRAQNIINQAPDGAHLLLQAECSHNNNAQGK